jgi:hypothetical protein
VLLILYSPLPSEQEKKPPTRRNAGALVLGSTAAKQSKQTATTGEKPRMGLDLTVAVHGRYG